MSSPASGASSSPSPAQCFPSCTSASQIRPASGDQLVHQIHDSKNQYGADSCNAASTLTKHERQLTCQIASGSLSPKPSPSTAPAAQLTVLSTEDSEQLPTLQLSTPLHQADNADNHNPHRGCVRGGQAKRKHGTTIEQDVFEKEAGHVGKKLKDVSSQAKQVSTPQKKPQFKAGWYDETTELYHTNPIKQRAVKTRKAFDWNKMRKNGNRELDTWKSIKHQSRQALQQAPPRKVPLESKAHKETPPVQDTSIPLAPKTSDIKDDKTTSKRWTDPDHADIIHIQKHKLDGLDWFSVDGRMIPMTGSQGVLTDECNVMYPHIMVENQDERWWHITYKIMSHENKMALMKTNEKRLKHIRREHTKALNKATGALRKKQADDKVARRRRLISSGFIGGRVQKH